MKGNLIMFFIGINGINTTIYLPVLAGKVEERRHFLTIIINSSLQRHAAFVSCSQILSTMDILLGFSFSFQMFPFFFIKVLNVSFSDLTWFSRGYTCI